MELDELTYEIRGCIYDVYKTLGPGLLESVYEEEKPSLCVYDSLNNIFITLDESFKGRDILAVVTGNERIYVLFRISDTNKILKSIRQLENKD